MSGSPANGLKSNMAGSDAVCDTDSADVSDGTNQTGKPPVIGSDTVSDDSEASVIVVVVFSLASMKKSSAAAPVFVIVTGTVIGVPDASVVLALSGSPAALVLVSLKAMFPVNGSDTSLPSTGSAKSTTSVQVPATGLRV